jgi:kynureninase
MPLPVRELGVADAWVVGGGYKYLQYGEGNAYMRLPDHADRIRPVVTGWFAEFGELTAAERPRHVAYGPGGQRFAGATYDPSSNYRAARVAQFFADMRLSPAVLQASYRHQRAVLAAAFDALDVPDEVVTRDRDTPPEAFGGFLALRSPWAGRLREMLRARGVMTDSRGEALRLGPAPYLSDAQLAAGVDALGEAVRELAR